MGKASLLGLAFCCRRRRSRRRNRQVDTVKAMEKDILTTAQTAKLLGVSVRTAQLLIEGGSVPSWKTPGGHRRVYRTDIEALIEGGGCGTPSASATVIVITPGDRIRFYEEVFAAVPECEAEIFEDLHAALFALGSARPHAIVVDLADGDVERSGLLHSLVANPSLGHSRILAVGASVQARKTDGLDRVIAIDTPEQAVAAVRRSLADTGQTALPPGALPFPVALNEGQRLVALERSGLLGTAPEETFDRLTWLASQTLKAPISLLTLLTPTQQWFKSRLGLDLRRRRGVGRSATIRFCKKGSSQWRISQRTLGSTIIRPLRRSWVPLLRGRSRPRQRRFPRRRAVRDRLQAARAR